MPDQLERNLGDKRLVRGSSVASPKYIDATANRTRQAARANRTYRTLDELAKPTPRGTHVC